jgi:adenine specific DNA methylase Mod
MRPRCVELHRVLEKTGSFYYHCDWHASHYVKIMLDQIFGENQFVNEIIWKRQSAHSDAKQGSKHLGRLHDAILLYAKSENYTFNHAYQPYSEDYIEDFYRYTESEMAGATDLAISQHLAAAHHRKEIRTTNFWA